MLKSLNKKLPLPLKQEKHQKTQLLRLRLPRAKKLRKKREVNSRFMWTVWVGLSARKSWMICLLHMARLLRFDYWEKRMESPRVLLLWSLSLSPPGKKPWSLTKATNLEDKLVSKSQRENRIIILVKATLEEAPDKQMFPISVNPFPITLRVQQFLSAIYHTIQPPSPWEHSLKRLEPLSIPELSLKKKLEEYIIIYLEKRIWLCWVW